MCQDLFLPRCGPENPVFSSVDVGVGGEHVMVGAGMLGMPGQHPSPPHPHMSSSPTASWVGGLGPELEDIQGRGARGQRPGFAEVHMELGGSGFMR